MHSEISPVETYFENLQDDRKAVMKQLHLAISSNLPEGYEAVPGGKMLNYVVPHRLYPAGYHVNPKEALPFVSLAVQKNQIAIYHMGIYALPHLHNWFVEAYQAQKGKKPDMGKSCIRFKKLEAIPMALIGELCSKLTVQAWIDLYEQQIKK